MSDTCCPNCGYDIDALYEAYCEGTSAENAILPALTPQEVKQFIAEEDKAYTEAKKWIKFTNYSSFFDGSYSGYEWDVECKCPECGTEFCFSDASC